MTQRYNIPDEGTADWHVPLNENFAVLDTDVEIRDVEENLEKYDPAKGAKFFATDTGRRYLGDGSEWTEAALSTPTVSSESSDSVEGQLWYNENDGALRIATTDGVIDIV